jgi:hypothetical protein
MRAGWMMQLVDLSVFRAELIQLNPVGTFTEKLILFLHIENKIDELASIIYASWK